MNINNKINTTDKIDTIENLLNDLQTQYDNDEMNDEDAARFENFLYSIRDI
jgi:hypothetical protein